MKKCLNPECEKELVRKEKEAESAFQKRKYCDRKCASQGVGQKPGGKLQFPSRFTGRSIHITQWLAEYMCDRQAKAKGITLVPFFWQHKPWSTHFRHQMTVAASLLREFPPQVLGVVLKSPRGQKVWSLGLPALRGWCREEMARQAAIPPTIPPAQLPPPSSETPLPPRPTLANGQSLRQLLRSIDG